MADSDMKAMTDDADHVAGATEARSRSGCPCPPATAERVRDADRRRSDQATGLAFVLMASNAGSYGSTRASSTTYVIPGVALFLGITFREESVAWLAVSGSAVALVGCLSRQHGPSGRWRGSFVEGCVLTGRVGDRRLREAASSGVSAVEYQRQQFVVGVLGFFEEPDAFVR